MDAAIRNLVWQRAGERCEYCRLPQESVDVTFHVDHITAKQHIDEIVDDPNLLALACNRCNLHKGTNLSSIDPDSGDLVSLFHPRNDAWGDHFDLQGAEIVGITPTGRATARLLQMNAKRRLQLRANLIDTDSF
jgi:hypothetical protein